MTTDEKAIGRRNVLGVAAAALGMSVLASRRAAAQGAGNSGPAAPIQRLNAALLAGMRQGSRTSFLQRFDALMPVIDQTFDLQTVLADSIGLSWPGLPDNQKAQLLAAFRRYTVSSYAANFDSFSGQRFEISPTTRSIGNGEVIVATTIVPTDGSPIKLDYVMRNGVMRNGVMRNGVMRNGVMRDGAAGWQAVDVLADGSISRVAVQRSDFRHLLSTGGVPALVTGLQNKVANLSGGMLA